MTYHSAKGLQFETVFLPDISPLPEDERGVSEQKALYVAMTRTYRYLYVMYSGELPEPLSLVPRSLYLTTETEVVEDI
jgi:superfamily I DNA/RNA helicase